MEVMFLQMLADFTRRYLPEDTAIRHLNKFAMPPYLL
jgi:hypothetical protein